MSILEIHKKGEPTKIIDLTPVEEIRNNLENILMHRKNWQDRSHIRYSIEITEKIKQLNKDQLIYLSNSLISLVNKYADFWQMAIDEPEEHLKSINKYKKLKKDLKEANKTIENYEMNAREELSGKRKRKKHFYGQNFVY